MAKGCVSMRWTSAMVSTYQDLYLLDPLATTRHGRGQGNLLRNTIESVSWNT